MGREWKPGDVAVVGAGIGFMVEGGAWYHADESWTSPGTEVPIRPLAVIDPESLGDRDRLCTLRLRESIEAVVRVSIDDRQWNGVLVAMQAALREFANPTPPKPDEPTGLGAVVEDAEGVRWIRTAEDPEDHYGKPWQSGPVHRHWQIVDAVRVLSEGVTS